MTDEEWQQIQEAVPKKLVRDPLSPAYKPGDTVYLSQTAYEITGVGLLDVQLQNPARPDSPPWMTERDNFERMLQLDPRNAPVSDYLSADLRLVNDDLREVLTVHLLTEQDKGHISDWIRSGDSNHEIAARLSEAFDGRAETIELVTGDVSDYFTSTDGIAIEIQDKYRTRQSLSWEDISPILPRM